MDTKELLSTDELLEKIQMEKEGMRLLYGKAGRFMREDVSTTCYRLQAAFDKYNKLIDCRDEKSRQERSDTYWNEIRQYYESLRDDMEEFSDPEPNFTQRLLIDDEIYRNISEIAFAEADWEIAYEAARYYFECCWNNNGSEFKITRGALLLGKTADYKDDKTDELLGAGLRLAEEFIKDNYNGFENKIIAEMTLTNYMKQSLKLIVSQKDDAKQLAKGNDVCYASLQFMKVLAKRGSKIDMAELSSQAWDCYHSLHYQYTHTIEVLQGKGAAVPREHPEEDELEWQAILELKDGKYDTYKKALTAVREENFLKQKDSGKIISANTIEV